jgi:hypothetical protein
MKAQGSEAMANLNDNVPSRSPPHVLHQAKYSTREHGNYTEGKV